MNTDNLNSGNSEPSKEIGVEGSPKPNESKAIPKAGSQY